MNRKLTFLTMVMVLLGFCTLIRADEPWMDSMFRMQIRFAEELASPLTNFPVLVMLDETIDGFVYDGFDYPADGADLRFANANEDALLDYEIEEWNTNGASYVWVKAPLLESTNDFMYAYWGRSGVSHAPSTTNGAVWSEDFAAVWHMNNTNVLDSTANENHPTSVTALTATNGMINGAMAFNGLASGDSRVVIPNDSSLNPAHLTFSAWVKPLGAGTHSDGAHIFSKGRGANPWASYTMRYRDNDKRLYATISTGGTQYTLTESDTVSLGQFYLIAATYDGSTFRLYRDGVERASMAVSGSVNYSIGDNNLHMGGWNYGGTFRRFNGITDNLRISSVPRSADWLYASWLNQASNHVFLAFDLAPMGDDLAVSARPASGIGSTSATLNGRVVGTGEAENPEVHVAWGTSDGGTNALTDWHASISMGTAWGSGYDFETTLTALTAGETYYYRTYVTNSTGEAWSQDVRSFTTVLLPAIANLGADWVRRDEALVQGEVTSDGGEAPTVWVELWAGSASTSSVPLGVQSVGPVSTIIEGLDLATLYHFRFAVSNGAGVAVSAIDTFTTLSSDPVTWYVAPDGPDGVGTNWATAFVSLHDAMDVVVDGDTILLTNTVHMLTESIAITNGITISGPWGREQTTIKRDTSLSLFRLFSMTHSDAVIEGVTLTQGRSGAFNGGGIYMTDGLVRDVIVDDCRTGNNNVGGAIYIEGGRIESSVLSSGYARNGAGIRLLGSGVVSNVIVTGNSSDHGGGGVYISGGNALLTHSVIENNHNAGLIGGGGIWLHSTGGTVQNCLIRGNSQSVANNNGGGIRQTGGSLVNSTVVGNSVPLGAAGGGGVHHDGGTIINSIVYGNSRGSLTSDLLTTVAGNINNSIAPELDDTQNNNLNSNPEFVDLAGGDFRLSPESPAIDSGIAVGGIVADLDGVTRPQDGNGDSTAAWDMGAYEALPVDVGSFRAGFRGTPRSGMEPLSVSFEAFVAGSNTTGLVYSWDINGSGTPDWIGSEYDTLSHDYLAGGLYTVTLAVSNSAGQVVERDKPGYITVNASEMYVATNGLHISPFSTWANAATNLAAVMALADNGAMITVSNGVYDAVNLQLDFEVDLISLNGPDVTTLDAGGAGRVMQISHPLARVEGFTLRGGNSGNGGAVNMSDGTIRNCHIRNSTAGQQSSGGGVYMTGGRLLDSTISHNTGSANAGGLDLLGTGLASNLVIEANASVHGGGGVRINSADALLTHSVILNNTNSNNRGGVGVWLHSSGGTVRNCLIRGNRQTHVATSSHGGGVRVSGGLLINCTIVSNSVPEAALGGGVYHTAGAITNTIVYGNLRGGFDDDLNSTIPANIGYSCAPELDDGVNGNISSEPGFEDTSADDFHLAWGSPAIDAGINQAWMMNATDLDGNPRVSGKHVDMGAYEYQHPARGTMFIFR